MPNVFIVGVSQALTRLVDPSYPDNLNPPDLFVAAIEFLGSGKNGEQNETFYVTFTVPGASTYPSIIQFFDELKESVHDLLTSNADLRRQLWIRTTTDTHPDKQLIYFADSAKKRFYHKDWPFYQKGWPEETPPPKPVDRPFTRNAKPEWPVDLSFTIFGKDHLGRVSFNIVYDVRAVNMSDPPSVGKVEFKGHVRDIPESGLREIVLWLVVLSQVPDYAVKGTFEHLLVVATQVMLPDIERKCSVALGSTFQVSPNYFLRINNDVRETLRIPPAMLLTDDKAALGQSWIVDPLKLAELTASTEAFGINFSVKEVNNPPAPDRTA